MGRSQVPAPAAGAEMGQSGLKEKSCLVKMRLPKETVSVTPLLLLSEPNPSGGCCAHM